MFCHLFIVIVMSQSIAFSQDDGIVAHYGFEYSNLNEVKDDSSSENNALLVNGAHVVKEDSKCGASVALGGGEILMNGQAFRNKPSHGVTIALWVKLNRDDDNLSFFNVKQTLSGNGASYTLEVKNGKLHWSHADEKGNFIFDLLTVQSATVPQDLWTHIAATYAARTGRAKLYVDAQLIKTEMGTGPLSTHWQGKVAIGADGSLPGLVDEFYIMNKALSQNDVKDLTELCNLGPDYAIPMEKGAYNGLIPVDQLSDAEEGLKETKGHRHSSFNKNAPSASSENADVDPASLQMKDENSSDENQCSKNSVFYSADLKGSRNSGLFTRVGHVEDVKDCIQKCCRTPRCDLAYMDKSVCYTVICHFPSLCQPIRAVNSHTTLGYVSRKGETVFDPANYPTEAPLVAVTTKPTTTKPTTPTTSPRRTCVQSMVYFSVALRGGWTAGKFTDMGVVHNLRECVKHCCDDKSCDLAMVLSRKCFTVHCYSLADCQTMPDGHAQIAYVSREGFDGVVPTKPTKAPSIKGRPSSRPEVTRRPMHPTPTFSPTMTRSDPNLVLHLSFDKIEENRVIDDSKYGNDASLTTGANISPGGGIRGNGVVLDGGDVLLDGEHFEPKPRQAITISLWVKVLQTDGIHSLFDTVGSKSDHKNGQYHFEIVDGKVRWFHRDESAEQVFSVTTDPVIVRDQWTNIAATYDANLAEAKIFVNGQLKTVDVGHGELSMDWGAKAGFGTHIDGRALLGYIDDIYIYSRALDHLEIQDYVRHFKEILHQKPVAAFENEHKITPTLISVQIHKPSLSSHLRLTTPKPRTASAKIADVCQLGKVYNSADLKGALNAGNFLDRGPVNNILQCMEMCCMFKTCDLSYMISGRCYLVECYSRDLCGIVRKGLSALAPTIGLVVRPGKMPPLIKTTLSPPTTQRTPPTTKPTTKKTTKKRPPETLQEINDFESQLLHPDANWYTTTTTPPSPTPPTCIFGPVLNHTTMVGGLKAGEFSHKGLIKRMDLCQGLCCNDSTCDVAIMMKGACFLVACKNKTLCKPRHAELPNFSLKLSYKKRPGATDISYEYEHPTTKPKPKPTMPITPTTRPTKPTTKPSKIRPSHTTSTTPNIKPAIESSCKTNFILDNVRLVGGLYSGIYRTIGHVHNMKACMNACCDEKECTVAYMERGVCYAMKCTDKELCKSTIGASNSSVGYVTRDDWSLFKTAHDAVTDTELVNNMYPSNNTKPGKQQPMRANGTLTKLPERPTPEPSKSADVGYCEKGETLDNHRLMGGMKAGIFRDHGEVENIETCSEYCCRDKECHLAYMVDKSCYSVKCFNSELCKTFAVPHFFLNPVISFVSRTRNITVHATTEKIRVSTTAKPESIKPSSNSTTASSNAKGKPTPSKGRHPQKPKHPKHGKESHEKHGKHVKHDKHKDKGRDEQAKESKHFKEKEHKNGVKDQKHHEMKPTVSEKMMEDKKLADQYRNLLKHKNLLRILEQMEDEGSGSATGSGGSGSGDNLAMQIHYIKILEQAKSKHKVNHKHRKIGPRKHASTSKNSDVSKVHPVPLSKIDVDLIDELSSGAPSAYESCPADEFGCEHFCITLLHGGHRCMCHKGYRLSFDGRTCVGEDQCDARAHKCDQICVFDAGDYRCECRTGYIRSIFNQTCDDIDECAMGIHGCDHACINTLGSYRCLCANGYKLNDDQMTCTDLSEPSSLMKKNKIERVPRFLIPAMIVNGPNDTEATQGHNVILNCAAHGYPAPRFAWSFGMRQSIKLKGNPRMVVLPGGSLLIQNVQLSDAGVYRCIASNNAGTDSARAVLKVADVDECKNSTYRCEHMCHNTIGSFYCSCYSGYALQPDRFTCQDEDECVHQPCSQYCFNTPGSYLCGCKNGYRLHQNRRNCTDVDECNKKTKPCNQACNNTEGSYQCYCFDGYRLKSDNVTCENIPLLTLAMRNSSPVSAGFGALAAICTILVAIIVSSFATLIRNYKKRRKYALENQRQNDGRPPIKIKSNSKSIFSWMD